MKKTDDNRILISSIFIMSLLVANVVAGKVVDLFGFIVPAAVVAYAITFLCTDVVGEIWGKEEANKLVKVGFISQVFALILIILAMKLPPAVFAQEYSSQFVVLVLKDMFDNIYLVVMYSYSIKRKTRISING